jgi:hypothetical protein
MGARRVVLCRRPMRFRRRFVMFGSFVMFGFRHHSLLC